MRVAQSPAVSPQKWGSGENGRLHLHFTMRTHTKRSSKTVVSAPVVGAQSPKNRRAIARKGDCGRRRAGFRKNTKALIKVLPSIFNSAGTGCRENRRFQLTQSSGPAAGFWRSLKERAKTAFICPPETHGWKLARKRSFTSVRRSAIPLLSRECGSRAGTNLVPSSRVRPYRNILQPRPTRQQPSRPTDKPNQAGLSTLRMSCTHPRRGAGSVAVGGCAGGRACDGMD